MTKEEWKEWALSLKPGDTVVIERWGPTYMRATVQKITPTGRVNTDKGVFYQSSLGWYEGYGTNRGYLLKPTPELLERPKSSSGRKSNERESKKPSTRHKSLHGTCVCHVEKHGLCDR